MQQKLLRDLIEQHIHLGAVSSTGFHAVRCAVCNDHSERAGFKFDGSSIGYSCFNCGTKLRYEELSGELGKHGKRILMAFGISEQEIQEVLGSAFFVKAQGPKEITMEVMKPAVSLFTPEVALPPQSYPIGAPYADELQAPLIEYLYSRGLDPLELNAHFSLDQKYLNRVILPCMRDGKIIYWQARTILNAPRGSGMQRYLSPGLNKEAVLWGYDNLWYDMNRPLFVTEGIFDAAPLKGVALIGSKFNDSKLAVLNKCRRRKIYVMDKDDNGMAAAQIALREGWEMSFPGEPARGRKLDVNECVVKYGRAYTIWTLMKNATSPKGVRAADGLVVESKLRTELEQALVRMASK